MKQENNVSTLSLPLITGLCLVVLNLWWRYSSNQDINIVYGSEIQDLHLYDITFPLLILNLGMYKSSLYKNRKVLYVLVNVALIVLNVFVLMR